MLSRELGVTPGTPGSHAFEFSRALSAIARKLNARCVVLGVLVFPSVASELTTLPMAFSSERDGRIAARHASARLLQAPGIEPGALSLDTHGSRGRASGVAFPPKGLGIVLEPFASTLNAFVASANPIVFAAKRPPSNAGWAGTLADASTWATCGLVIEFDASVCDADALGRLASAFAATPDPLGTLLAASASTPNAFTAIARAIPFAGRPLPSNASRPGILWKAFGSMREPLCVLPSALDSLLKPLHIPPRACGSILKALVIARFAPTPNAFAPVLLASADRIHGKALRFEYGMANTLAKARNWATCLLFVEFGAFACDSDASGRLPTAFAAIPDTFDSVLIPLASMPNAFAVISRAPTFSGRPLPSVTAISTRSAVSSKTSFSASSATAASPCGSKS